MRLFFEVREGPNRGLRAPVTPGLQIGRTVAYGLRLKDSKVSSVHAEVHVDEEGRLVLIDKGSTNLIKTAEGRVASVNLFEGLTFKIGGTRFPRNGRRRREKSRPSKNIEERQMDRPEWRQLLVDYFRSSDLRVHQKNVLVRALNPAIEVEVMRGSQLGTVWTLGYGPREFGKVCADLTLWDEDCADIAFQITAQPNGEPMVEGSDGAEISS